METKVKIKRTNIPKSLLFQQAIKHPLLLLREVNNRSLYEFTKFFWGEYSSENFQDNWHIKYLCNVLQTAAEKVARGEDKKEDIIINIPPGTTKTVICSIMFPLWCWTRWYWMRFICVSYSATLALESAEYSRDIMKSDSFKALYPELELKKDKEIKSNFRVVKKVWVNPGFAPQLKRGGNRYSTSVGGTVTGFHAHIIIWDDPINPQQAHSEVELESTNRWMTQTLPTRKVNKAVTLTVGIMQRLRQNDPTGHLLDKKKNQIFHICLPGEINTYKEQVKPPELAKYYVNNLLDPIRMSETVLKELNADLGQYGYAGQIGQNPVPPAGGMFKVDMFASMEVLPHDVNIEQTVRYWDKAGTKQKDIGTNTAAFTVGVKMHKLRNGKYLVADVKRGRWSSEEREEIIRSTAEADGTDCEVWYEQEPGSGGKESAEETTKRLAGFIAEPDHPKGDKVYRADPFSVQVNWGNVILLKGDWNYEFIEEYRYFPFSKFKDQVDAGGGAFSKLTSKQVVESLLK